LRNLGARDGAYRSNKVISPMRPISLIRLVPRSYAQPRAAGMSPPALSPDGAPPVLNHVQQIENQQDDEDRSEAAARTVAPAAAMRPRRQRADKYQDQDDQKDGKHFQYNRNRRAPYMHPRPKWILADSPISPSLRRPDGFPAHDCPYGPPFQLPAIEWRIGRARLEGSGVHGPFQIGVDYRHIAGRPGR